VHHCIAYQLGIDRADLSDTAITYSYDEDIVFSRVNLPHMFSPNDAPPGCGTIQAGAASPHTWASPSLHRTGGVSPAHVGQAAEAAINRGVPALADDPSVLATCPAIDILPEVTGNGRGWADVVLQAFDHCKHVVLVNAELDSLVGLLLKARADSAGVVVTHTDGDEPGAATTVLRYLRLLGLRPVAAGNIKGMGDHTSFADSTKLFMETTVLANATGFHVGRRAGETVAGRTDAQNRHGRLFSAGDADDRRLKPP